jgi:hypothetical protein
MYVLLYCGVCIGVRLLPPGENPIVVRNNNNNNNNNKCFLQGEYFLTAYNCVLVETASIYVALRPKWIGSCEQRVFTDSWF